MLRKPLAASHMAFTLAVVPVMAQTPAPGPTPPTPQQLGTADGGGGGPAPSTAPATENSQGKVIGTPKQESTTEAQRGASVVPLVWISLLALGAAAAVWLVWNKRRRRS